HFSDFSDPCLSHLRLVSAFPARRSSDLTAARTKLVNSGCGLSGRDLSSGWNWTPMNHGWSCSSTISGSAPSGDVPENTSPAFSRSEEHTSELQSREKLVCRLLLEKKKKS